MHAVRAKANCSPSRHETIKRCCSLQNMQHASQFFISRIHIQHTALLCSALRLQASRKFKTKFNYSCVWKKIHYVSLEFCNVGWTNFDGKSRNKQSKWIFIRRRRCQERDFWHPCTSQASQKFRELTKKGKNWPRRACWAYTFLFCWESWPTGFSISRWNCRKVKFQQKVEKALCKMKRLCTCPLKLN